MNKLLRGSVAFGNETWVFMKRIEVYFGLCDITLDKINYLIYLLDDFYISIH